MGAVLLSQIFTTLVLRGFCVLKRSLPNVRKAMSNWKNFIGRFFKRSMESLLSACLFVEALSQIVESGSFTARKTSRPLERSLHGRFCK